MTLVPLFRAAFFSCSFSTPQVFFLNFFAQVGKKKSLSDPLHSSHPTEKLDSRLNFLHTNLVSTHLCLSYSWNLSLACCLKEQKKRHTTPQLWFAAQQSLEDQCPESETWRGRRDLPLSEAPLLSCETWRGRRGLPIIKPSCPVLATAGHSFWSQVVKS